MRYFWFIYIIVCVVGALVEGLIAGLATMFVLFDIMTGLLRNTYPEVIDVGTWLADAWVTLKMFAPVIGIAYLGMLVCLCCGTWAEHHLLETVRERGSGANHNPRARPQQRGLPT